MGENEQWFSFAFVNTREILQRYNESGGRSALTPERGAAVFQMLDKLLHWKSLATHLCIRRPYGSAWHDNITRHYTGHDSAQSYYKSVGSLMQSAMSNVKVPVLCFLAEDDPVTPPRTFRHLIFPRSEQVPSSPNIVISLTKHGGHCGWFCGFRARSWSDEASLEFLEACGGIGLNTSE